MAQTSQFIKVEALTLEARRDLTNIQKDQFPFALGKTLNQMAFTGAKLVQKETRAEFSLHTEFIPRGIGASPKTGKIKNQIKRTGIGASVVFTKPKISVFMPIHETGGERTPSAIPATRTGGGSDKGRVIALPARVQTRALYTQTGRAKKTFHPRTLLKDWNGPYRLGRTRYTPGGSGKRKAFIIVSKTGQSLVVRRTGRARDSLEIFWSFSKSATFQPVWSFEQTVVDYVNANFKRRLNRNLFVAVKTAR